MATIRRTTTTVLIVIAALASTLAIAAPSALAGGDDSASGDEGSGPELGVTYAGEDGELSVRLTALAPTNAGETQARVHLRLRCGDGQAQLNEALPDIVASDGSFTIEKEIHETGGGSLDVEVLVEGRFTDERSTTASFSYDVFESDDDGNSDSCEQSGDLELEGGSPNPGLQRVEVAIPVEFEDDSYDGGPIVTSEDAVFATIGQGDSAGPDSADLYRIDPVTNEVLARQTVPIDVNALVVAGPSLYGIDADNGTLLPIDTSTLTPGAPIQIAPPRVPDDEDWALWPAGAAFDGAIWLSATRDQEIVRFDPATGTVVARFPVDAHPAAPMAGPEGLYVETQTGPLFATPSGRRPETNVIRRIDPASGATIATSPEYSDGSIGGGVATADAVVIAVAGAPSTPDRLLALDPETLEPGPTARLQYPVAAAPPSVWTVSTRNDLVALDAELTREIVVPYVTTSTDDAGVGFDAIWVYNHEQRSVYRISTS